MYLYFKQLVLGGVSCYSYLRECPEYASIHVWSDRSDGPHFGLSTTENMYWQGNCLEWHGEMESRNSFTYSLESVDIELESNTS